MVEISFWYKSTCDKSMITVSILLVPVRFFMVSLTILVLSLCYDQTAINPFVNVARSTVDGSSDYSHGGYQCHNYDSNKFKV